MPPDVLAWVQLALSTINVLLLPLVWNGVKYIIRTERRLVVIETKLGIPVEP